MKLLLVTHSSRRFQEKRASLNFLEKRFASPGRLTNLPRVESYPGVDVAMPFDGALSLWAWKGEDGGLECLGAYRPGFKIQFAEVLGNSVLVLGSDRLEVLDASFSVVRTIRHPHLIGAHTVFRASGSMVWVTTAPGNAALLVDIDTCKVLREQSMPEQYGQGHELTPELDLSQHCIPTDHQPTHINCAFPCDDGLLVTLWIPGAVGMISPDGAYREIVAGFRGCHGGRIDSRGELYFSDSAAGMVWFMDAATGAVRGRFHSCSRWVHDCVQIESDVYACTLSDDNELLLFSRTAQEPVARVGLAPFGASAMFINTAEIDDEMASLLADSEHIERGLAELDSGPDAIPPVTDGRFWTWCVSPVSGVTVRYERKSGMLALHSDNKLCFEVLVRSSRISLQPGTYRLLFSGLHEQGKMMAGIEADDTLLCSVYPSRVHGEESVEFNVDAPTDCFLVVAAANGKVPCRMDAAIQYATIQVVGGRGNVSIAPRRSAYLKGLLALRKAY